MTNPTIISRPVTAKPRRLQAKWTAKSQQDAENAFRALRYKGFNLKELIKEIIRRMKIAGGIPVDTLEDDLVAAVAKEITDEIDAEIVKDLKDMFGSNTGDDL